jgi:hypothetical protein
MRSRSPPLWTAARAPSNDSRWSSRRALVFAALTLLVVDRFVPFGRFFLYPFTLLSTWVHERGHGLAALWAGGFRASPSAATLPVWRSRRWGPGGNTASSPLGVLFALDTVSRIDYLFTGSVFVGGEMRASDIANVTTAFGGLRLLWGLLLAGVSLSCVALGLWAAWRKPRRPAVLSARARRW